MKSLIDLYTLYTFVKRLATPFKEWRAFKLGVIDHNGEVLIAKEKRNSDQKASLSHLDILILNLKKQLSKVPGANNRWVTYGAALLLLKETDENTSEEVIESLLEDYLYEDGMGAAAVPANNMGGGAIAIPNDEKTILFRKKLKRKSSVEISSKK